MASDAVLQTGNSWREWPSVIRPITSLLKQEGKFEFTPAIAINGRKLLAELPALHFFVFHDWDVVANGTRPFQLYGDVGINGFGANLEQKQPDDSTSPILYINRATLDSEHHWTSPDLKTGSII